MNYIIGDSIQDAWVSLLKALSYAPERHVAPRGIGTREIIGLRLEVPDMRNNIITHPVRNINFKFMVAEALWMAFGRQDLATLARYNSQMARFSDNGTTLTGAYGPRLAVQWHYIIDTLRNDPNSRQAVATIWTPNPQPSRDVPCTISLQFLIREEQLHLIATMRSSDVWLGLPYDTFSFTFLAACVAGELGISTGRFIINLGSSHLYDTNFEKANEILTRPHYIGGLRSPRIPGWPSSWLEKILVEPKLSLTEVLGDKWPVSPWSYYANVLKAANWPEAQEILDATSRL